MLKKLFTSAALAQLGWRFHFLDGVNAAWMYAKSFSTEHVTIPLQFWLIEQTFSFVQRQAALQQAIDDG